MPASALIAMALLLFTILKLAFRLEKRLVWPHGELQPHPHYEDQTGYGSAWVSAATSAGFSLLGWVRDLKGENYRLTYAILVSSDRTTLAIIGFGFIFAMPIRGTWLHTRASDGRSFYSTDRQTGVQVDVSRHWTNQLVPTTSFDKLWQRHRQRIQEMRITPRMFHAAHELEEFRALRVDHYRSMEQAGLIAHTDGSATEFPFTLFGAARTAVTGYFLGLARALTAGRFPRNA